MQQTTVADPCAPFGTGPTVADCMRLGIVPPPPFRPYRTTKPHWSEPDERYKMHVWLNAYKTCSSCERYLPVAIFEQGEQRCEPCIREGRFYSARAMARRRTEQPYVPRKVTRLQPRRDAFVTQKVRRAI